MWFLKNVNNKNFRIAFSKKHKNTSEKLSTINNVKKNISNFRIYT